MGSIFVRGTKLWLKFKNISGKWNNRSSGFDVGKEAQAQELLDKTEAKIRARKDAGETEADGPLTVRSYSAKWLTRRDASMCVDDASRLKHVLPTIGSHKLDEVRPRHIRELVMTLAKEKKLAPRTVRHVYGVLHTMFHDAVVDELIDANPCVLKRGDLPKKVDKDPSWRPGAVFTREEGESLFADERIPEDRRVLNAILLLSGTRFGEAAALRWSSYDPTVKPLGKLVVASSYNIRKKIEKSVKTERPREVPVHPTLAAILAEWKLAGWERLMGRKPSTDDLIIPSRLGANRSVNHALKRFHQDCERIGMRPRRQHDLRRTFITLARTDGARKDVLEVITHGSRGDIVDIYTSLPWQLLCEEVQKLRLERRMGRVLALRKSAEGHGRDDGFGTVLGTAVFAGLSGQQKSPESRDLLGFKALRGGRDLNPRPPA
jgi:integrase